MKLPRQEQWTEDAACNDPRVDPEVFFIEHAWPEARMICSTCPVRNKCLREFMYDQWAFAGGMTPDERKELWTSGEAPPRPRSKARWYREPTDEECARALNLLGMSYTYISRVVGLHKLTVERFLKSRGQGGVPEKPRTFRGREITDVHHSILVGLYSKRRPRDIAQEIGCHEDTVYRIRHRFFSEG